MRLSPEWGTFNRRRFAPDTALYAYTILVSAAGAGLVAGLALSGSSPGPAGTLLVLCAVAAYAKTHPIPLSPAVQANVSSTVYVFAAVLFGPLAAAIVVASSFLVVLRERGIEQRFLRRLTWTASDMLVALSAGGVAVLVEGGTPVRASRLFAAVVAASLVQLTLDVLLGPIPASLRGRARWIEQVRVISPLELSALPLHVPLIGVLAYMYLRVSPWSAALCVLPVLAAQRLLVLYHDQKEASTELALVNRRLSTANLSFATALVATLDARDRYTAGHSAAVAIYARDIALRMGLGHEVADRAHLSGLVHDVGKIGLPVGLLEKAAALGAEERRQMEMHSTIGERILRKVDGYSDIAKAVRHHHERVDGQGYPDRLAGEKIPLISRIIAVADAYNAMTSDRPYRDALPTHVARIRLAQAASTQFDTAVVAAFEALLTSASKDYRRGIGAAFSLDVREEPLVGLPELAVVTA